MKNKKITISLILVVFALFLTIIANFSKNDIEINKLSEVAKSNIKTETIDNSDICLTINSDSMSKYDFSNINVVKDLATDIVIGKIIDIEGYTNYNEKLNIYTRINTLGNIEIHKVLKGNLKSGDIVKFIRGGGHIPYNEYIKSLSSAQLTKINNLINFSPAERATKYVVEKSENDIVPETSKTYLMFLFYDEYSQRYEIFAEQYGLREFDTASQTVKDNNTNNFNNLKDVLRLEN